MSPIPPVPPSGTVTFLFTDIEGSTALWEAYPEAMEAALARHDTLLRQAIAAQSGFVFHTLGDAFCAAFATAALALAAGLDVQRRLPAETRGLPMPMRVRMGLHTGAVEFRDGDYFGQPLNRVSRLMTAGHGSQILLSVACQELTRDTLPDGVTLRDLGPHRLKDLARPEQVFQVLHPDLPADFPPLRSLDNPALPNNLPQQMTSFIGREGELAEIKALLEKSRLLTLTGTGGAGKTRLSLQAAADLLDGSADGVWLVELASLSGPDQVPQAVAEALNIREEAGRPIAKTLTDALRPKRLLLVLDNCEHVLAACAFLVSDLLRVCPNISILATSREALGVPGEQTYRVPSLSLPDPRQVYTAEALSHYEAVRLFIDRAGLSQPSFAVTNQNAPAVAQICARLDGIPLAIELAAARVKALSVEQIGTRLDNRFRLLTGGSRTALPRQQTLKAAIDWSYDLLTGSEKTLLRRLSVFTGGWTLEAAEAVSVIAAEDVLDLLSGLVDKSLVAYEEDAHGLGRYRLLETVRQYGRDRSEEADESDTLKGRHQEFFLALAEQAVSELIGPKQVEWLDRLETEYGNLRSVLEWCLIDENRAEVSLRLSGVLGTFWLVRGYLSEGRLWLGRALDHAEKCGVPKNLKVTEQSEAASVWTRALTLAGGLASAQGDTGEAESLFERASILAREAGDKVTLAYALRGIGWCRIYQKKNQNQSEVQALFAESLLLFRQREDQHGITLALRNLGDLASMQGDYPGAQVFFAESLSLSRRLEDQHGIAGSLLSLARTAYMQGDLEAAWTLNEEALPLSRQLGDQGAVADTLLRLGLVAYARDDPNRAKALLEEALPLSRQLGLEHNTAFILAYLGRVAARQGDQAACWELHTESLRLRQQLGSLPDIAEGLEDFAEMASDRHQPVRAARLLGAAHLLRETLGTIRDHGKQNEHDQKLISVRVALGNDTFAAEFAGGHGMSWEQAVTYALAGTAG